MNPLTITYVLTALAAVVVVLTRVRLRRQDEVAGRLSIPHSLLNVHTVSGVVGLVLWVAYLVTERGVLGYVGLGVLWVTVVAGLLILLRWLPARGRHSSAPVADTWGEGPGLSALAHIGMLVGVTIFTVFVAMDSL